MSSKASPAAHVFLIFSDSILTKISSAEV